MALALALWPTAAFAGQGKPGHLRKTLAKTKMAHPRLHPVQAGLGIATAISDPSGKALAQWHAALGAVVAGKAIARIAFYGASHTAADLWTGELRRRLQERYGEGGHGFVLPSRWNIGYRHQDIVVQASPGWLAPRHLQVDGAAIGDFGLAGVRMDSGDPAQFAELRTTESSLRGRSFDHLQLWWRSDPAGGDLTLTIDGTTEIIATKGPVAVQRRQWQLPDMAHVVRLQPVGNGNVAVYGAVIEKGTHGVVVDQLGIPGMQAGILQHWAFEPWAQQVAWRKPDLVVLAYGTNDVAEVEQTQEHYAQIWRQVLAQVRKAAPQAACIIVGPTDRLGKDKSGHWTTLPRMPAVIATQIKVAAELGCGHWDAQAAMGGAGAMLSWQAAGLATRDHVHLTKQGYVRLAELFDTALHAGLAPEPTATTAPAGKGRP